LSELDGTRVLITGAGSGIGHAIAARFRADGAIVAGCDLAASVSAVEKVCDHAWACDVTDADSLAALVAELESRCGGIDVLVANAGIARIGSIEAAAWSDIEDVVRVNLFGVLHSIRAVLPGMRRRSYGRIIVVASRNAEFCPAGLVGYNVSKAAVVAMTRTLARELDGTDVLVNNLIPGPSATGMNPRGELEPDACYPTVRMLATLPPGGPSGRTFFKLEDYAIFSRFSDRPPLQARSEPGQ
jgi:2-hydroxycyclohexanecarboxyl-CoA dehydrogenase